MRIILCQRVSGVSGSGNNISQRRDIPDNIKRFLDNHGTDALPLRERYRNPVAKFIRSQGIERGITEIQYNQRFNDFCRRHRIDPRELDHYLANSHLYKPYNPNDRNNTVANDRATTQNREASQASSPQQTPDDIRRTNALQRFNTSMNRPERPVLRQPTNNLVLHPGANLNDITSMIRSYLQSFPSNNRELSAEDKNALRDFCTYLNRLISDNSANTALKNAIAGVFHNAYWNIKTTDVRQFLETLTTTPNTVNRQNTAPVQQPRSNPSIYTRNSTTLASLRQAVNNIPGRAEARVQIAGNSNVITGLPSSGLYIRGEDGEPLRNDQGQKLRVVQTGRNPNEFQLRICEDGFRDKPGPIVKLRVAGDSDSVNSGVFRRPNHNYPFAHVVVFNSNETRILVQGKASMGP